jgi:hypothetical protein
VVTAFSLAEPELIEWPGFDGFFNACLLRRPAREFNQVNGSVAVQWVDEPTRERKLWDPKSRDRWNRIFERRPSAVRYFGREPLDDDPSPHTGGAAGWDNHRQLTAASRNALRRAAGIEMPSRNLVAGVVSGYLLLLVPLNWLLFRTLGRSGWAWVAVPVIALAATGGVVALERLNLGFSRARFEVGVVECQPDHPRAHVTRYSGLSTALGTEFRLGFDDASAIAVPQSNKRRSLSSTQEPIVDLQRLSSPTAGWPASVTLAGIRVASNSLGIVRSEAMLPAAGSFELTAFAHGNFRLANRTRWSLGQALIVGQGTFARLDSLPAGATRDVVLSPGDAQQLLLDRLRPDPSEKGAGRVDENPFLVMSVTDVEPGELRLVGWTTELLPGTQVDPAPDQTVVGNLIVAHLRYAPLPPPDWDVNLRIDVAPPKSQRAP